jgi:hypothetical protein
VPPGLSGSCYQRAVAPWMDAGRGGSVARCGVVLLGMV